MIFVTLLINYLFLFSNIGREIDDSIVEVTLTKWVDKNQYFRFTRSVSLLSIAANLPFVLPTSIDGLRTTTFDFTSPLTAISYLIILPTSLTTNSTSISTIPASVISGATGVSVTIFYIGYRLNFMANINFEYFKNFKYYAVPNGELCCPVCGDKETFQTSGSMDGLTLEETKMVWNHVHEAHSIDFDRIYNKLQSSSTFIPRESVLTQAMQLVAASNGRINEAISLWALTTFGKQEVLAAIEKEHKELEKKLGELF
ncbi:unnamed protein product [Rotaria magnacalcarata]|uniref:Uncharacterized protein n=1 Tax=Rotaria magnacalcarata TaxID=392030 RepID=A0A815SQD3_9BILA|nr:unnamed protein product [Rotaria magnacalcarata]